MRQINGMRGFLGSVLAALSFQTTTAATPINIERDTRRAMSFKSRGYKVASKVYPFSSDRQHKRYARQIAAGQLNMEAV